MTTINLPAGITRVRCDAVALIITHALWPDDGTDDEGWDTNHGFCLMRTESEIVRDVGSGMLPVKDALTRGPLTFLQGNAWKSGDVTIADLRAYVAHREMTVVVADARQAAPLVEVGASDGPKELYFSVLATRAELLDAFEKWGMRAAWFDELDSHKWLLDARRRKGQGQRGHVIPPLFCPYLVMDGLMHKVRKAKRLNSVTAWRTLEHKFPTVYTQFESYDPRKGTGD